MKTFSHIIAALPLLLGSALGDHVDCRTTLGTKSVKVVPRTTITSTSTARPTQVLVVQSTITSYKGIKSTSVILSTSTETVTDTTRKSGVLALRPNTNVVFRQPPRLPPAQPFLLTSRHSVPPSRTRSRQQPLKRFNPLQRPLFPQSQVSSLSTTPSTKALYNAAKCNILAPLLTWRPRTRKPVLLLQPTSRM